MTIKKVWILDWDEEIVSMTLESENVIVEETGNRIQVQEQVFPDRPTKVHPLRHIVYLGLFDIKDLYTIRDAIDKYLMEQVRILTK